MTKDEIANILGLHQKWVRGEGGARADLSGANLSRADLSGADLSGADLSRANLSRADLSRANLYGANLYGANLYGANLSRANLSRASGNLRHLKSVFLDTYPVTYTDAVMQIGCQRHAIADWWGFSDESIRGMDGQKALDWWAKYKPLLQQIIAASPAEPTGFVTQP